MDRNLRGWSAAIDDPTAQHPVLAQPAAEKAVSGDLIKCLAEDAIGHIYACTELGVDELDPVSESLRRSLLYTGRSGQRRFGSRATR